MHREKYITLNVYVRNKKVLKLKNVSFLKKLGINCKLNPKQADRMIKSRNQRNWKIEKTQWIQKLVFWNHQ